MGNFSGHLVTGIAIGLMTFGFTYAVLTAAGLPDVWFSYETQECVKVLNYEEDDNYSCENMPPRYYHVWVE
jgi:hypothetical protein